MNSIIERANQLEKIIGKWLIGEYRHLLDTAIERTISDGLFEKSDVLFAVRHLENTVLNGSILRWVEKVFSTKTSDEIRSQTYNSRGGDTRVLCLHAGNVPLVGFQDLVATLTSGNQYYGKLSSKDPWLLKSLVDVFQIIGGDFKLDITTDLNYYRNKQFTRWMFAGSETSLHNLKPILLQNQIIHPRADSLRRVAHFSAVILPKWDENHVLDIIEGILRYGGKGCRSIALISTDVPLEQLRYVFEHAAKNWHQTNGTSLKESNIKKYRQAYNNAIGQDQIDLCTHLIQDGIPTPDYPEIIYKIPLKKTDELKLTYGRNLQQVYLCSDSILDSQKSFFDTEPAYFAQRPPIDWKPDQTDPLEWLITQNL